ncbi:hypothetical protein HWC53_gp029 [Bacillus phage vB_BmeM-Goe8]|uniref:HNH endonuclease n=1 Tax=Bacillus phage vB_BmeM-Goe8 TaxID=2593638 RepID=A0A516KMJ7_9CAUD|nr:hypothetical protein HWC53_gp029 [Bacillus phage vB_BmeM-Goe8]QDP42813.1 hypothetical protein Goe8_c00290 [Bacillus phage vB_BmeM-Goe8]
MAADYRHVGIEAYGDRCEICGYHIVEVHHIDYQEHQAMENKIRAAVKNNEDITELLEEAAKQGWVGWDGHQLEKATQAKSLSVLCPNCHTLVHRIDCGMKILGALTPRK